MTLTVVVLCLLAAATHAGWNLIGKRTHPSTAFFAVALAIGACLLGPVVAWQWHIVAGIPAKVWLLLVATGFCEAIYVCCLAGAYAHGDMSVAYPLARALPIVGVTALTHVFSRGDPVSSYYLVGAAMVVGGCVILPKRRFSEFRLRDYVKLSCLLAAAAGLGTVGYSIIDKEALDILRAAGSPGSARIWMTTIYFFIKILITLVFLLPVIALRQRERENLREVLNSKKIMALLTGVAATVAYVMILMAMGLVSNVSYVVALRELGVPLGAILGVVILREPPYVPKLVGVAIIFAGMVLVALG